MKSIHLFKNEVGTFYEKVPDGILFKVDITGASKMTECGKSFWKLALRIVEVIRNGKLFHYEPNMSHGLYVESDKLNPDSDQFDVVIKREN